MSIEIIGLRFTHRKSIKPSLYGPFFNYFGGGILRYYLHLLRPDTQIVAIVEAEKTAVVASIFFPDVLFLATGGLQNLNAERCAPLKGHRVILFPDLGAEDKWREKAAKIPALKGCIISTWLANHASAVEREKGLDLADYLEGLDARCKLRVEDFLE